MPSTPASVLIIERNLHLPVAHLEALSHLPLRLTRTPHFTQALARMVTLRPAAVILCERGASDHLQALTAHISDLHLPTRVIVLVAHTSTRGATAALRADVVDYVSVREPTTQVTNAVQQVIASVPIISDANAKNSYGRHGKPYRVLEQEYADLRQLLRDKDDFIALISHELRTPLMTVTGYLELLKKYANRLPPAKVEDFINRSLRGTGELAQLADLLMHVLQFEAGYPHLQPEPVALLPLITTAVEQCDLLVTQHAIICDVAPDLRVQADVLAVQHVMRNLLSNALKYSPDGGAIHISARRDGNMIAITVQDEGIGMTPAQMTHLFERFTRVHDQARWPTIRGTGLGLYICRHIVTALSGHIWAESTPGQGSTLHVTLPAPIAMRQESALTPSASCS